MDKKDKYKAAIDEINSGVVEFNHLLAENQRFKEISFDEPASYSDDIHEMWGGDSWPSKDRPGVYILCGYHEKNQDIIGLYIGKASNQNIGHRIYTHFHPQRKIGRFTKKSSNGEVFIIEAICAIAINDKQKSCLASALEEFLIARVGGSFQLLQTIGVG